MTIKAQTGMPICEVKAQRNPGSVPKLRFWGGEEKAIEEAQKVMTEVGWESTVSVWVQCDSRIIWAAGEAARELERRGAKLDGTGRVIKEPVW